MKPHVMMKVIRVLSVCFSRNDLTIPHLLPIILLRTLYRADCRTTSVLLQTETYAVLVRILTITARLPSRTHFTAPPLEHASTLKAPLRYCAHTQSQTFTHFSARRRKPATPHFCTLARRPLLLLHRRR
jgi:hypothetical protein